MGIYTNIGSTPPITGLRYGSNCENNGVEPPQNVASILQISSASTTIDPITGNPYVTYKGNGFELGLGAASSVSPQILTFPVSDFTNVTINYPTNSPKGSICLDSDVEFNPDFGLFNYGVPDMWVKTGANQADWTPVSSVYFTTLRGPTGAPTIANNTITFINLTAPDYAYTYDYLKLQLPLTSPTYTQGGYTPALSGNTTVWQDAAGVVAPFTAYYLIFVSIGLNAGASNATYNFYSSIYVNGVEACRGFLNTFLQPTGTVKMSQNSTIVKLNQYDVVNFAAWQDSGSSKGIANELYTRVAVINLGG